MKNENILQGLTYNSFQYCVTSVIVSYFNYYGIDLMNEVLGRYWAFYFKVQCESSFFDDTKKDYIIKPVADSYIRLLQRDYGISFKNIAESSADEDIVEKCKYYIDKGIPLIVNADPYYFENYDCFYKFHGLNWNHYITIYGYSDKSEYFKYLDSTRAFISGAAHELSYHDLKLSIYGEPNIYSIKPEIVLIEGIDENKILQSKHSFLINDHENEYDSLNNIYYNYDALMKFSESMKEIGNLNYDRLQNEYLDSILNQVVIICQHRKANLEYCRRYMVGDDVFLNNIVRLWNMVKFSLSPARKKDNRKRFFDAAEHIQKIADLEKRFIDNVKEG